MGSSAGLPIHSGANYHIGDYAPIAGNYGEIYLNPLTAAVTSDNWKINNWTFEAGSKEWDPSKTIPGTIGDFKFFP